LAEPVRARRLTQDEGRKLQQLVRRGKHDSLRVRRALIIMASASGTPVPAIARPSALGRAFTCWSLRKLADYLATDATRQVMIGRDRLRQILRANNVSWQRTRTWKEPKDPDFDAKLDRIEEGTMDITDRCFAFDQFGPLSIRPHHGRGWAPRSHPDPHSTAPTAARSTSSWITCRRTRLRRSGRGRPVTRSSCASPDQRVLGEPDRGAVRTAKDVHNGELGPAEPPCPGSRDAPLPALAQPQRTPYRRLGRATPLANEPYR
jgi:hypothetical protein